MSQDATLPFIQIEALLLEFRLRSLVPGESELGPLFERIRAFGQSGAEVGMQPAFKAAALLALAESRLRDGDAVEAQRWANQALAVLGDAAGQQGGTLRIAAIGRMLTGIALLQQGQPEQALNWLREAQTDFAKVLGPDHPTTQLFALNNALALAELQRAPEAFALVKHAELVLREALGVGAPTYQKVLALLHHLESRPAAGASTDTIPAKPQTSPNTVSRGRGFFS
jgi:tetratricopeptide (TPR) repeat protein